jgi:hypothetical protein
MPETAVELIELDVLAGQPDALGVVLAGAAIPTRGVAAASTIRHHTVRYPGSARPTRHIMGITDEDIRLAGRLHDGLLGRGEAARIVATLQQMLRRARRCALMWGSVLVREGHIGAFTPSWYDDGFVDWELTFLVDRVDTAAEAAAPAPAPPEIATSLDEVAEERRSLVELVRQGASLTILAARKAPPVVATLNGLGPEERQRIGVRTIAGGMLTTVS